MTDWFAAFPNPTAQPGSITPAELPTLMREKDIIKDYLVIDVRRTDFEEASIVNALNLPAQSFFQSLPAIVALLSPVPLVIFQCNSCKPGGRGPRAAGWYQDAIDAKGISTSQALVLEGGIRAWITAYGEDEVLTKKL
ncbi:Rhodanese-like domain-containing protein [Mycena rebaudengoi]|nr:Rhodanese-like domain-containing protein [Mycena rebaudengoi]